MTAVHAVVYADGATTDQDEAAPLFLQELDGVPVAVRTVTRLLAHPEVTRIVLACAEPWVTQVAALLEQHQLAGSSEVVLGGPAGDEAIHAGLAVLEQVAADDDIVVIHDIARPLVAVEDIDASIAAAREHRAAVVVGPASEGVVRVVGGTLVQVHPAHGQMFITKTPQTFRYGVIWDLYSWAHETVGAESFTPAHLCSFSGVKCHAVPGGASNVRIAGAADLEIARALLATDHALREEGRA